MSLRVLLFRHNAVKPDSLSQLTLSMQLKPHAVVGTTQAAPPVGSSGSNMLIMIYCCYEAPNIYLH